MTVVLIVDDNSDNIYYLQTLLTGHQYEVEIARHGAEALVKARKRPPDIVISDLLMPVMDGYTLLRHWKADDSLKHAPFIVYTATYTEAEDERLAYNLGADAFIVKPAEPDVVLGRVREMSSSATAATPMSPREPAFDEKGLLEEYSAILIRKLEHKTLQLETANRALRQEIDERELGRLEKLRLNNDLRERVKELRLLYEAARLFRDDQRPIGDVLSQVVGLIPGAMRYPTIAAALIAFDGEERSTPGFRPTPTQLEAGFTSIDGREGRLQIVYVQPVPRSEADPFLMEERAMIDSLLEMLRVYVERRAAQEAQRTLQAELTAEQTRLITAQQIAKIGSWETDLNTLVVVCSDETRRIFEIDPGKTTLTGDEFTNITHPDDRPVLIAALNDSFGQDEPREVDHRLQMPDGRLKHVRERWQVFHDEDGRPVKALGTCQDISEQVHAEQSLRESEVRYRTTSAQLSDVLNASLDLICSFDTRGRFVRVNAACEPMLGYTVDELLGTSYLEYVVPADLEKTRRVSAAATRGAEMRNFENRYVRKNGEITHIQWVGHWSSDDQIMFCVGRDVTETKLLEAQFLRAQRMESIGTLAGGIAHDFNNILAPILMSIELLKLDADDPARLDILSTIERSSRRGADMVRQLLSFARGVESDQVLTQVRHLVHEVETIAGETFLKSITVRSDLAADLWPVFGDPTQLHQVLMNLCVNARDAMPEGGTLTLTASNIELDERAAGHFIDATPGRYVLLEVTDTGTGMAPDVLDRAFEPFFTTKDIGKGTGLGLSTSQAIVRGHGGFMHVTSRPAALSGGGGTSFRVYLPASPDAEVAPADEDTTTLHRGNGELVLLVDDDTAVRDITRQTLEAFGYRVLVAGDGAEALDIIREHGDAIDVVLTDMMMPTTDGPTMIRALASMGVNSRVVVVSGLATAELVSEARSLGVDQWLTKPYNAQTLLGALHAVLGSN